MVASRRTALRGGEISWTIVLLSLLFVVSGSLHFVMAERYQGIIPVWIIRRRLMVQLSGVAELLGGISLLIPAARTFGGWGLILLLVSVFPANVEMLRQAYAVADPSSLWKVALWIRLPLQGVLIWWIGWATQLRLWRQPRK